MHLDKMIKELTSLGISIYEDDIPLENMILEYKKIKTKIHKGIFYRTGGMCKTHEFVSKNKKGGIEVKWIPITDEMYYELHKKIILKTFGILK